MFSDTFDHEWTIRFLEHDIADRKFIYLIRKTLKADVLDGGKVLEHEVAAKGMAIIMNIPNIIKLRGLLLTTRRRC
ncbi:hypothetical protein [Desulfosporosinus sp. OT]|uniref:hypothetical protein n=1 Tax=Desulfosporosinus sp. OT TaxID=913865 RepID=UPI000591571B|nr:hypothetical protein [Desulfosporosinus sp. OT]